MSEVWFDVEDDEPRYYKTMVVSGGFDPLHSGHIDYLESASSHGDELVVLLNSDEWLIRKKGTAFMPFAERKAILESLACNPRVFAHDDSDGSARKGLEDLVSDKRWSDIITFCNGGDRTVDNIPEGNIVGIEYLFNVGGEKTESSSGILSKYLNNTASLVTVKRTWGHYSVLWEDDSVKVKELVIKPNSGISMQRHRKRSEQWFISKGTAKVKMGLPTNPEYRQTIELKEAQFFQVRVGSWHQLYNESSTDVHVIEIQYGEDTREDDIERHSFYGEEP